MLEVIAPNVKKTTEHQDLENSDSKAENPLIVQTSTNIKSKTTTHNNSLLFSRNESRIERTTSRWIEADCSKVSESGMRPEVNHNRKQIRSL